MSPHAYSEDQLVEQAVIGLFARRGWQTVSANRDAPRGHAGWRKPHA